MQERNDRKNKPDLPPQLLRSAPRQVEPNLSGMIVRIWTAVLFGAAIWSGTYFSSRARTEWPMLLIPPALLLAAVILVLVVRRQSRLLSEGRPALATVTKAEKVVIKGKTTWRVHYEWILLSGAKRTGRYKFQKKEPPLPGTLVPIVYDRDEPSRHAKYPLSLVRIKP